MPKGKKSKAATLKEVQQLAEYNLMRGIQLGDKIQDLRMKIDKNNTKSKKFRR